MIALLVLLGGLGCAPTVICSAEEDGGSQTGVTSPTTGDPILYISTPGSKPPDHRADGKPVMVCYLYDETLLGVVGSIKDAPTVADPVEGGRYLLTCLLDGEVVRTESIIYDPAKFVVDPAMLAQYAERSLPLLYPAPATAPPRDAMQLVGLATWLWIDPQDYREVSATVAIANLSVTATAHPSRVVWDPGDGSAPLVCDGPGTPYRAGVPDDDQHTDCRHAFVRAGE